MDDHDLEFIETFSPSTEELDFLTGKINEESRARNIYSDAYPFGIFVRKQEKQKKVEEREELIFHTTSTITATRPTSSSTSSPASPQPSSTAYLGKVESISKSYSSEATNKENKYTALEKQENVVGGCNGSIIYGSIYTDQLWVDPLYRKKGIGKILMEKVHELGRRKQCAFATVGTMDFQGAQPFYGKLGYVVEYERGGYANGGKMIYLKKELNK